jgi:hypothetical protein
MPFIRLWKNHEAAAWRGNSLIENSIRSPWTRHNKRMGMVRVTSE